MADPLSSKYEELFRRWGFSLGYQSQWNREYIPEIWDKTLGRVFASDYISDKLIMDMPWWEIDLYLLNFARQLTATAIFERAVWKKYRMMSWELDQKGIEIEL